MSGKPTYVLGTGLSHDGSACLLKDGRVAVAIEKERLTRKKHDGFHDAEAIQYCLDAEGIQIDDVAVLVQNANFSMFTRGNTWFRGPRPFTQRTRVVSISHHLAHAYSALGTCPFDEASVLVVDGCGNAFDECLDLSGAEVPEPPGPEVQHLYFEKDSYYAMGKDRLRPVYKDFSPWGLRLREHPMCPATTLHSIGGLYGAASSYALLGMDDPGKLMGLAPYGRAGAFEGELFSLRDGRVFVRYEALQSLDRPTRSYADFKRDFQYYADVAYWVQRQVEGALLYVINHRYERAPSRYLAYAGGVALNAVANRRILRETKFEKVHIVPAAGDNGIALGCAFYGWLEVLGRERVRHSGAACFGKTYPESVQQRAIAKRADEVEVAEHDDVAAVTAELVAAGNVVGFFQAGSEFGPRALGHRSILADPRSPTVRDHINTAIKYREDFRPFAPAVPLEDATKYFDCDYDSPYMILVAPIREQFRELIPATVHRDGSCRLQTVRADSDPLFHRTLREFERLTGIAVLLNTSFNRRGMPIVETPEHAVDFFLECALDALVLGRFVVTKKASSSVELPEGLEPLFGEYLKRKLDAHWPEVARTGGVLRFQIRETSSWTVDLTGAGPVVLRGGEGEVDTVFELTEADLRALLKDPTGKGTGLLAAGKIRMSGNPRGVLALEAIAKLR